MTASLCLFFSACGREVVTEPETTAAAEPEITTEAVVEPLKVCMIFADGLGDGGQSDICAEGGQRAKTDFDIQLELVESPTDTELGSDFLGACEDGYDLIIGAAPEIADYVAEYGADYPEIKFTVIDAEVDLPNVWSVSFEQKEAYFLAGAAAAMLTEDTEAAGVNEEHVIGWMGGMNIPVLEDFYSGFEHGAMYINPEITILRNFAGEWYSAEKGKELMAGQYKLGADLVMDVTFGSGAETGVLLMADASKIASVETCADKACYLAIQSFVENSFPGGTSTYLSIKDGGVKLDYGDLPVEIVEMCEELAGKIAAGEIVVGDYEPVEPANEKE